MVTFDSFLNFIVPIGIVAFFIGVLYSKLKNEIHALVNWIKSMFENTAENIQEVRPQIIYD